MTEKLSPDFLNELFKTCLRSKTVLEIAINHVQYHFLPTEEYKELWKAILNHFRTLEQIPSIGSLAEQFKLKPKVIEQLRHIKEADVPAKELILTQLEIFVKKAMFLELHSDMKETYEKGQYEKAIEILTKKSENIANFSLKAKAFESIFSGFENRYNTRMINNSMSQGQFLNKASFGIDSLDSRTYGGLDKGKTCLITARSGIGKSFLLRWIGYYNARMGKKVLHFQFEGSKKECTNAYDALMAGSNYHDMNLTCLSQDVVNKVIENSKKIAGDIKVIAYEQFDAATMVDVRNSVIDHFKSYGDADVILIDYLDEVQPGDGIRYSASAEGEKARKRKIAKLFTNLCVEFNMSGFIPTQASDVPVEIWNNPNKVMTRSNIKGDKNLIDPFSIHITMNQTMDEYKSGVMRLYEDKFRDHPSGKTHYICTAYKHSRFYDRKRTLNTFGDEK